MEISEKVAYIQGLAKGLELGASNKEGQVINEIVDLLGMVSDQLSGLESGLDLLYGHVTELSEDVDLLFEDEDDDCDCGCGHHHDHEEHGHQDHHGHHGHHHRADDLEDYDGDVYEVTCPFCAEEILLLEDSLDVGYTICPECDAELEIDFSGMIEPELLETDE